MYTNLPLLGADHKMVLKLGKFGIRSGNTFKASKSKFLRQYRKQSVLIRSRSVALHDEDEEGDTGDMFGREDIKSDEVAYSLNKKGRWLVPGLIKDAIKTGDHDCGILLVESHKVLKKARHIGIYSTHAPLNNGTYGKVLQRKRRGYLHEGSILNANKAGSRRQRRRRRRLGPRFEEVGQEREPQPSMVRYDVVYPSPLSSSVTHNPKYVGHHIEKPETSRLPRGSRRRVRLNGKLREQMEEAYYDEDDFYEDTYTHAEMLEFDNDVPLERNYDIVLADLLNHANAASKLARSPSSTSFCKTEIQTKGKLVYEEPSLPNTGEQQAIAGERKMVVVEVTTPSTNLEAVYVLLPNEQVDPNNLRMVYQDSYIECDCFPRKFIVNISSKVSDIALFRHRNQVTNAFIIFEYDVDNEINGTHESVYKITFNSNFAASVHNIKIETLFDYMETNVDEIIKRTCFFLETLGDDVIEMERKEIDLKKKEEKVDLVLKWRTQSYKPSSQIYVQEYLSSTTEAIAEANDDYAVVSWFDAETRDRSNDVSSPDGRLCCICYDTIGKEQPGTAVMACSHWACNICWRQYLEEKLNGSTTQSIPCPEFDCKKTVDPGTVLSLVTFRLILKFAKRLHDANVERQDDSFWCPNANCGRVVALKSQDAFTAHCICGARFCVKCRVHDHYPSPCSAIKEYYERLEKTGDARIIPIEALKQITVQGKLCPHCKRIVEKKGGCPYMSCACGKSFCWGCGGKFGDGIKHGPDCSKGHNDSHQTQPFTLEQPDMLLKKKRARWYQMAVTHRVNQHPEKIRLMKLRGIDSLASQIQRHMTIAAKRGEPVDLHFDSAGKQYSSEKLRLRAFVNSLIQLYSEANKLIEHCALLLESDLLPEGNQRKMTFSMHRLSMFLTVLFSLFSKEQTPKCFTEQLVQVRQHILRCINAITRNVTPVQQK